MSHAGNPFGQHSGLTSPRLVMIYHVKSRTRITTGSKQTKQTGINNDIFAHHDAHHAHGRLFVLISGTCSLW